MPKKMKPDKPACVIHISEGLVQGITSTVPMTYIIADADVEGCDLEDIQPTPPALKKIILEDEIYRLRHELVADVSPQAVRECQQAVRKNRQEDK